MQREAVLRAGSGGLERARHDGIDSAAAFDQLYQDTKHIIFRYAWVLCRNEAVAEDITAEVYLRAWCSRDKFRGDGSVTAWLISITYNAAMTHGRAVRRGETIDIDEMGDLPDHSDQPEWTAIAAAEAEQVHLAIRELTPEQQQVVHLRFFEGLSHERVARIMDRAPNAVRALQFRALKRLRTLLAEDGLLRTEGHDA